MRSPSRYKTQKCTLGRTPNFLMLNLVVHIVTTGFWKVNTHRKCSFKGWGRVKTNNVAADLLLFDAEHSAARDQNETKPIPLDCKLSPCSECCILSSGWFPGIWILYADVSEHCGPYFLPTYSTYEDGTECSETSAYNIQRPRNHQK